MGHNIQTHVEGGVRVLLEDFEAGQRLPEKVYSVDTLSVVRYGDWYGLRKCVLDLGSCLVTDMEERVVRANRAFVMNQGEIVSDDFLIDQVAHLSR